MRPPHVRYVRSANLAVLVKSVGLGGRGYGGEAILPESKFGFYNRGNDLRISLLRAVTEPNTEQDRS